MSRTFEDIFEAVTRVRAAGERAALATVVSTRGSTPGKETMRLLVTARGEVVGTVGGGCVESDVIELARSVLETDVPRRATFRLTEAETGATGLMCGGELEVFVEPITAPSLVLFGAGHISRDLCAVATTAGFRVTVVDDRSEFASVERFPDARTVIAEPSFEACFEQLAPSPSTYCVVVTRGHLMDKTCVDYALHTDACYVGCIGSQVKIRAILSRLRDEGRLEGIDLSRLHAPIGIDIGGGTHGEITVSIVAELIAHRRQQLDGLRTKRMALDAMQRIASRSSPARVSTNGE